MRPAEPIQRCVAVGGDGKRYVGTVMQYQHYVPRSMEAGDTGRWVPSNCLRLRIEGYLDGPQDSHDSKQFLVPGLGYLTLQE